MLTSDLSSHLHTSPASTGTYHMHTHTCTIQRQHKSCDHKNRWTGNFQEEMDNRRKSLISANKSVFNKYVISEWLVQRCGGGFEERVLLFWRCSVEMELELEVFTLQGKCSAPEWCRQFFCFCSFACTSDTSYSATVPGGQPNQSQETHWRWGNFTKFLLVWINYT